MRHPTHYRVVSTAMQLFREKGYGSTSVADLLKAADVNSGSLYNFFPGKREVLVETDCLYGCPVGSLALEIHEPDPPVRERLAAYFLAWTDAVHECLIEADCRLPDALDRLGLAEFVLTTMEGAVMQARTFRDVACFDRAVQHLR